eukprot:Hpha_TRINITY_DN16087_c4_g2::TRINITY_DN16087_c4_g2_i1::g.118594::m.118594/K13025/EIF4A3, FAL1; ATP-dependent RNA helicase
MSGQQNAVDALLTRAGLAEYASEFKLRGLTNPKMLKNLTQEELGEIFPTPNQRKKFMDALQGPGAAPAGRPAQMHGGMFDQPGFSDYGKGGRRQGDRPRSAGRGPEGGYGGRDYGGYGELSVGGGRGGYGPVDDGYGTGRPHTESGEEVKELQVAVPHYTIPFLLGERAKRLNEVHKDWGTTNSRINRPEGATQSDEVIFQIFGAPGKVEKAKEAIEKIVGITKQNKTNQNFQDMLLGQTKVVTALLYALNERRVKAGLPIALTSETIPEHVSQFLFCNPYAHIRQFYMHTAESARKKFDIIGKIMHALPTVQCLIFCSNAQHMQDVLMKRVTKEQLFGIPPKFMHPCKTMSKEQREATMKEFEKGCGPLDRLKLGKPERTEGEDAPPQKDHHVVETIPGGFKTNKNRMLIVTDDYARYARKHSTPFVGFVINYDLPKTKEGYLHRIACTGRMVGGKATRGMAITLVSESDSTRIEELRRFGLRIDDLPSDFDSHIQVVEDDVMCPP